MKELIDVDIINIIRNTISNDFCKLNCVVIIDSISQNKSTIKDILLYCLIYECDYLFEKLYNEILNKFNKHDLKDFYYIYAYYKMIHGNSSKEYEKIREKYIKKNKIKILNPKKVLRSIKLSRILIKQIRKSEKEDYDEKIDSIIRQRLILYEEYLRYQILLKIYNQEIDEKIKRYEEWNLKMIKRNDTIRDREYLLL